MNTTDTHPARFPVLFLSHGGGPWPWVDGMKQMFAKTAREIAALPTRLPAKPKAVLVITGHWEAPQFSVSTAQRPPMDYDYSGFPEHTYHLQYPASGSPELAGRVRELLAGAGIASAEDPDRGYDHGTFVPMSLMYPDADVPVVLLSLKSDYDPAEHIRAGQALAPLRDEGVLILGSGLTYHNMSGFGRANSTPVADAFERYLHAAVSKPDPAERDRLLVDWEAAPAARLAHPREDHLLPLMVVAGAAGADVGEQVFVDHVMQVAMASYRFPPSQP
ncbi:class III extradiol ring-cleavage dioxygenase [Ramlibacter sp.]|uniref:DODA-type extradiol aromatic ring-opening family dioxygenase n=1 Tax=Ramlibacter sp. TaxID=1917967 RepID=UPI0026048153|nr:class III extradiol ring-cleavage dioxygenase [Ramlibacter sp.]